MTRAKWLIIVSAAVAMFWPSPASAQLGERFNEIGTQGTFESGLYTPDATEHQSQLDLRIYYGRFITDRLSIGPVLNYYKFEGSPARGSYGAFMDVHLGSKSSQFVPYIQGAIGQFYGTESMKLGYYSGGPGFKWFFGEGGGALNIAGFFRHQVLPIEISPTVTGYNEIGLTIGAAIYFGK